MKRKRKARVARVEAGPTLDEIVSSIVKSCGSPERVMELYYWAQSSHTLELLRAIAALPEDIRLMLERYLRGDPSRITIRVGKGGEIALFCPSAAEVIRTIAVTQEGRGRLH
jgi:hypothetical protein